MDPENIIKLFEGGLLAAKAVGAKFVAIAVKDYNEKLIMKLRDELDA